MKNFIRKIISTIEDFYYFRKNKYSWYKGSIIKFFLPLMLRYNLRLFPKDWIYYYVESNFSNDMCIHLCKLYTTTYYEVYIKNLNFIIVSLFQQKFILNKEKIIHSKSFFEMYGIPLEENWYTKIYEHYNYRIDRSSQFHDKFYEWMYEGGIPTSEEDIDFLTQNGFDVKTKKFNDRIEDKYSIM